MTHHWHHTVQSAESNDVEFAELPWAPDDVVQVAQVPETLPLPADFQQCNWEWSDWNALTPAVPRSQAMATASASPNTTSVNEAVADWAGDYGFRVVFVKPEGVRSSSTSWTYSNAKRKLYTNMKEFCSVHFITERAPPRGSVVCVVGVFLDSEFRRHNVERCSAHARLEDGSNQLPSGQHPFPCHWIRCDHPRTLYCLDEANGGRQCLCLPFEAPEAASNDPFTYHLAFMCRNSCPGSPGRKATEVVFILQSPEGRDIARRVIEVKVCACPLRDRRHDEQAAAPSHSSGSDSGNEGPFLLAVRREHYALLRLVHESLEFTHSCRREPHESPED